MFGIAYRVRFRPDRCEVVAAVETALHAVWVLQKCREELMYGVIGQLITVKRLESVSASQSLCQR
jgi:hypothetical protein